MSSPKSQTAFPFETAAQSTSHLLSTLSVKTIGLYERLHELEKELREVQGFINRFAKDVHQANNILVSRIDKNDKDISKTINMIALAAGVAIEEGDSHGQGKEVGSEGREAGEDEGQKVQGQEAEG